MLTWEIMTSAFSRLNNGAKVVSRLLCKRNPLETAVLSVKMSSNATAAKTHTGRPFSELSHLVNSDQQHLHSKYWKPADKPRFLLFMIHGFGGHCGRFEELALHLNSHGGLVFSHDHVGHGESEGNRTTVKHYSVFIRDIFQHIDEVKEQHPGLPVFLFGQSMGGALAVLAAHQKPDFFRGVVTHGGMLQLDPQMRTPLNRFLIRLAAAVAPEWQLTEFASDGSTRDEEQMKIILEDPLLHRNIKSHMALQLLNMAQMILEIGKDFSAPLLAVHGGDDVVCHPDGSRWLHEHARSEDKTLKIYAGCFHDVIHELPEKRKQCMDDIGDWISGRASNI